MTTRTPEHKLLTIEVMIVAGLLLLAAALNTCGRAEGADRVPPAADRYHRQLVREVRYIWGHSERVSRFAAQIHRESYWNERARSPVGAEGLGQIMPRTAQWLGNLYPKELGTRSGPFDPWWNLRALVMFDRHLYIADKESQGDEKYAFMLARYNAGDGSINKEQQKAHREGYNRAVWSASVEVVCSRRPSACKETVNYVNIIVHELEPLYRKAGW